jgi:hypothetical protein
MSQPLNNIGEPPERLRTSAFTTTKDSMDHWDVEPLWDIFQLNVNEILAAQRELVVA